MGSSTATFHARAARPAPALVSLWSLKSIGMPETRTQGEGEAIVTGDSPHKASTRLCDGGLHFSPTTPSSARVSRICLCNLGHFGKKFARKFAQTSGQG